MNPEFPSTQTAGTASALFSRFNDRIRDGEPLTIDALCAEHPDHAAELREMHSIHRGLVESLETEGLRSRDAADPAGSALLASYQARKALFASRYRIEGTLGSGGMGVILKAFDTDVGREVALKIIRDQHALLAGGRRANVASSIVARFLNEARITGQLEHPAIVPVHEIGVDGEGRPFFAMKLVHGRELSAVLKQVGDLDSEWTRERVLGVLLRVCDALAYAHEKGIIHRDLKPSNVMVGDFGEVYVMDWGLAKRVGTPEFVREPASLSVDASHSESAGSLAVETEQGLVVGTAYYMSPEQASGDRTRMAPQADVYAVGAMLYELLAGKPPFHREGESSTPTTIRERLSRWELEPLPNARVPAELQSICLRAMARDTKARYPEMRELARDLRAYLDGRVVQAYETGAWAETKKWVRRNRALTGAFATVFIVSIAGAVAFALKAKEAATARNDAVANLERAQRGEAAALASANEALRNADQARRSAEAASASAQRAMAVTSFVERALISSDPNQLGDQNYRVVEAMDKAIVDLDSGAVELDPETQASLEVTIAEILNGNARSEEALRLAERALAARQVSCADDNDDVATSLNTVAACLQHLGRSNEALLKFQAATAMWQRLLRGDHPSVAAGLNNIAACLDSLGRSEEALTKHEAALEMDQRLHQGDHPDVATALSNVGMCLQVLGRCGDALPKCEASLQMRQRLFKGDHPEVAQSLSGVGQCLYWLGRSSEALSKYDAALRMRQRLFKRDHPDVAQSLSSVALCLNSLGRSGEALPKCEAALEMNKRLFKADNPEVAQSLHDVASCLRSLGRSSDALPRYEAALQMRQRLFAGDHPQLAQSLSGLALCLDALGRSGEALSRFEAALEMDQRLFPGDHPEVATGLLNVGACLRDLGRSGEALTRFEAALEMRQRLYPDDHPAVASSLNGVGFCLDALQRSGEALPKYEAALAMRQRMFQGDHPDVATSLNNVAMCLVSLGRGIEALPKCEAALEMNQRLYAGDHPEVATDLNNVAHCLDSLGRPHQALPFAERALAMAGRVFPANHPAITAISATLDRVRNRSETTATDPNGGK